MGIVSMPGTNAKTSQEKREKERKTEKMLLLETRNLLLLAYHR
jgi:hypothetical protein